MPNRRTTAQPTQPQRVDPLLLKAQVAAWRQASDPTPCDCGEPLLIDWYRGEKLIATDDLNQTDPGHVHKRGDHYKADNSVDSYVIYCPACGLWYAVGQKHNG